MEQLRSQWDSSGLGVGSRILALYEFMLIITNLACGKMRNHSHTAQKAGPAHTPSHTQMGGIVGVRVHIVYPQGVAGMCLGRLRGGSQSHVVFYILAQLEGLGLLWADSIRGCSVSWRRVRGINLVEPWGWQGPWSPLTWLPVSPRISWPFGLAFPQFLWAREPHT